MELADFTVQAKCLRGVIVFSIRKPKLLCGHALSVSVSHILELNNGIFCEMLWRFIISGEKGVDILER